MKRLLFGLSCAIGLSLAGAHFFLPVVVDAAELEEIERRGYLIVGVKDNVRPLGFRDERGRLQGFEIELARRLAEELLGSPDAIELQPLTNRDRLLAVLEDRVDLTIARVTATSSRTRVVRFSLPYYLDGTALVAAERSLQSLDDLAGKTIAVLDGSSTIATIQYYLPSARLVGVESYQEGRSRLDAGEIDAFAADASVLAGWVQEFPQHHLLPMLLSVEPLSAVMPKGLQYVPLHQQVNGAIARWKADGWLRDRLVKWGLPLAPNSELEENWRDRWEETPIEGYIKGAIGVR